MSFECPCFRCSLGLGGLFGLALLPLLLLLGEELGRRFFRLLARVLFGLTALFFLFLACLGGLFFYGLPLIFFSDTA